MARRRARCSENCSSAPANHQVSKQAEGEGQDEEPTKALGLTIPASVLARADHPMTTPAPRQTPRAYQTLLATIRERCPEAEAAMAVHVTATLQILLPRFQGLTVTEAGVHDLLDTGLVAWQLAHSEPWGEAEDARRLRVKVLARAVVGQARDEVRGVLLGSPRN